MIRSPSTLLAAAAGALALALSASSSHAFIVKAPHCGGPSVLARPRPGGVGRRGGVAMFSDQAKLAEQAARLRAEAEKLEKELAATAALRPKPTPAPDAATPAAAAAPVNTGRALTFDQLKAEVGKALAAGGAVDAALTQLKSQGMLRKFESASPGAFRRYTADSFLQTTGFQAQEIESGGQGDDLKVALGVVLAVSSLAVFGATAIGGPLGTTLVYLFLLVPILFLGIGSSAPGVISVFIVLVSNLIDGKQAERKVTHEAARFLTGYLLGLPIESSRPGEMTTLVDFYQTKDGNFNQLGTQSQGPDARKKFTQQDILAHSVLAIAGSVAERMEYGKVIDRQSDFLYLVALMDLVRPPLRAGQKNDHVIFSALQAHKILSSNKSRLEKVKEKMAAKAPLEELIAAVEA